MQFDDLVIRPMREELTRIGLRELRTPDDVNAFFEEAATQPALVAINSRCGCAAGTMRPAVAMALERGPRPAHLATVFAGQEREATESVRERITEFAPSSPSVALFKDGDVVFMLERHQIEGHRAEDVAAELTRALEAHVGATAEG